MSEEENGNTTIQRGDTFSPELRRCRQCGIILKVTVKNRMKRFCSQSCRQKWWRGSKASHPSETVPSTLAASADASLSKKQLETGEVSIKGQSATTSDCFNSTCRQCGETMVLTRANRMRRFCSEKCRQRWWRAQNNNNCENESCNLNRDIIGYLGEQETQIILDCCIGEATIDDAAQKSGLPVHTIRVLKKRLTSEEPSDAMEKAKVIRSDFPARQENNNTAEIELQKLRSTNNSLMEQNAELEKQNYRLRLERDLLEKAAEIIKKGQGINLEELSNQEKFFLIDALREKYKLNILLCAVGMPKSSYCYQKKAGSKPDKYAVLRSTIKIIFEASDRSYGYRRVYSQLKAIGVIISEKIVIRIMAEEGLHVPRPKAKKYSSYAGEISPEVENIVNRNFHAEAPNQKWLTDITEFHIPSGKIYLSPIIDCFDGFITAWKIGVSPSAELVNTMLDDAIQLLGEDEHPILHSDRGCHYRWPGWIERTENANLIRSMSKKGCSPDNSACEGFFGRLKNEMFYFRNWEGVSIDEFMETLDRYLQWYNKQRIKISLGGMSPLAYRQSLGIAA